MKPLSGDNLSQICQQQTAQQSNPDKMGMLNHLLDADQDGLAVDDILGTVSKLFGRK